MEICLLTHKLGKNGGSGIERYSYEVYERLNAGHDVKVFEGRNAMVAAFLSNLTCIPFNAITNSSRIVHALTSRQATVLPRLQKSAVTFHDIAPIGDDHASYGRNMVSKSLYRGAYRKEGDKTIKMGVCLHDGKSCDSCNIMNALEAEILGSQQLAEDDATGKVEGRGTVHSSDGENPERSETYPTASEGGEDELWE